jgi:hypothetical protein
MSTMVIRVACRCLLRLLALVLILVGADANTISTSWAAPSSSAGEADQSQVTDESSAIPTDEAEAEPVSPSIQVSGSIWRSVPGIVFLQTPIGKLSLSSKTTLRDIRGSHKITLYVHGSTTVVDIQDRGSGKLIHRYVTTGADAVSGETKTLSLWTPEGEQSFPLGQFEGKLLSYNSQKPLTVEIDAAGAIRGIHDLQFDLQVSQVPHAAPHLHVLLNGTVAKLKSSYVFLRTPLGIVTVSTKTGVRNAKVGQDMTVWIHGGHAAIDLFQEGAPAPAKRFLTGPLTYASPDRAALTLHTPEGERAVTPTGGKTVLSSLKEGTPITVELDQEGSVVDIRRVN